ncbi:hypothetical protein [Acetivibrio cellulolyticus]|uniref:hypothetical protein n=1 Tax=Acetivibrio cellulolyticus TaxID=35830 RepID=UPI0001E300E8|nr:hypothetical protein [Acetivibrio cellulolyticus]
MDEEFYGKENEVDVINEDKSHVAFDKNKVDENLSVARNDIHESYNGTISIRENAKLYVILGWISAALTFFISPLFAVAGITFGILLNKQIKGSGNTLIIANVVLGLMNLVLGIIYVILAERMVGY